jgi:hypothetical protein
MKRLSVLAAAAGLSLLVTGGVASTASASDMAVVKGHVTTVFGKPIPGVVFKVVRRVPGLNFVSARGRTSATGRYEVRLPRGGSYQLVASDPGDRDKDSGDGKWAPSSRTVKSFSRTVRLSTTMRLGAKVSGHIVDPRGHAVRAGLPVVAFHAAGGVPVRYKQVGTTLTRTHGVYRFSNLPAGATVLRFASGPPNAQDRFFTGHDGGTLFAEDATPIRLTAGKAITHTDFRFVKQHDPADDLRPYGAVDPVGDAPAFLDITDLRVDNGVDDLVVSTTVPGFDPATLNQSGEGIGNAFGSLTLVVQVKGVDETAWTPRAVRPQFDITVGGGSPGDPIDSVSFDRYTEDNLHPYACTGLKADVRAGAIVATVPQSCFRHLTGADRGAVRVLAIMQGNVGPSGERDDTVQTRSISRG